jgi:hypothetical protein
MNEEQWRTCTEPRPMLEALGEIGKGGDSLLRLFACACVRRVWHLMKPEDGYGDWREAVEYAEEYADGHLTLEQMWDHAILSRLKAEMEFGQCWLYAAGAAARAASNWSDAHGRWCHRREQCVGFSAAMAVMAATNAAEAAAYHAAVPDWTGGQFLYSVPEEPTDPAWLATLAVERDAQAGLLRDVLGNPFRPAPVMDPSWLTWNGGLPVGLAKAAYENRLLPCGTLDSQRLAILADALEEAGCTNVALLAHLRSPGPHTRGSFAVDAVLRDALPAFVLVGDPD